MARIPLVTKLLITMGNIAMQIARQRAMHRYEYILRLNSGPTN